MILTRNEIAGLVQASMVVNQGRGPVEIDLVSVVLHLDEQFMIYDEHPREPFTPPKHVRTRTESVGQAGEFILKPGHRVLGCSEERVQMPLDLMGFVQTKGSLARGFLSVHMCDGQVDPGYKGKITFEILNSSEFYYRLVPGMAIAQLFFYKLASPLTEGYNGRYQNAGGPTCMEPVKKP